MADEDISVLIKKLEDFRDTLPAVLPDVAVSVSMAGKALAERVIKEKGFGETYSTAKVPAWFMEGKQLNGKGLTYLTGLKSKATEDEPAETTWGEFRAAQGLQSGYVDLSYSNKMWAGMFPQEVQISLFDYIAPLGNNTTEGQNKMNWNYERFGDYIGKVLTGDNMDILFDVAYEELIRLMDEKLGWIKS